MARGGKAAIFDRDGEKAQALAEELGDAAVAFEGDVTDEAQVTAAVDGAVEAFGELRLVVGCAGIGWAEKTVGKQGPANLQPFETVIRVNLIGMYNVLRLGAAAMNANEPDEGGERGCVVMTASIAALDGQIGQTAYSASKGGVASLTLPAARDLASRGIRVNTIAPGLFDTPLLAALPQESARRARRGRPVPAAPRRPARVRAAGVPHRGEPDAERRDDPARRRAPHAAALTHARGADSREPGAGAGARRRPRRAAGRGCVVDVTAAPLNPVDLSIAAGRFYAGPPNTPVRAGRRGRRPHRGRQRGCGSRPGAGLSGRRLDGGARGGAPEARGRAAGRRRRRHRRLPGRRRPRGMGAARVPRAACEEGETVLVLGATGVVGQIGVQAAKLLGAGKVIAAGPRRRASSRQLDADATRPAAGDAPTSCARPPAA